MSELLLPHIIGVRIILITNPLRPKEGRVVRDVNAPSGRRLSEFLFNFFWNTSGILEEDEAQDRFEKWKETVIVTMNGQTWPASIWTEVHPKDGDCIVIAAVLPQGGSLLRTLSTIAIMAASAALIATGAGAALGGLLLGTTLTGAAAATANAVLAGVVSLAGNAIVGAVLGPHQPSNKALSPSYDPDGPKTLAQSGTVIPKGYGTFMGAGNEISNFTDIAGSDVFINVLVDYGFGPARSMTGIQLNGKDISEYENATYYTRLGSNDQTEIAQFNQIVNGYPQQIQCLAGQPITVPGTGDLTQALQVDIQFPDGLYVDTNDGNIIPAVITYQVLYQLNGSSSGWTSVLQPQTTAAVIQQNPDGSPYLPNSWGVIATDLPAGSNVIYTVDNGPHTPGDKWTGTISVETFQPNGNHTTQNRAAQGEWMPLDINMNYVYVLTWTDGYVDFVAAQTTPCYNRTTILGLAPGKYDVQVIKYGSARLHDDVSYGDNWAPNIGQDMWVHEVNEITYQDLAYPNQILLGVRVLATGELSGSGINVTAIIQYGLRSKDEGLLPEELLAFEEDNPACVAADMMLDDLYGGGAWPGIAKANLERNIDEFIAWAENCDTLVPDGNGNSIRMCVFNGIFDNESNLWEQLGVVTAMSRAVIVPVGTDYGVSLDTAVDAPVQMFTVGNILKDSFTEVWLDIDSRSNQVEVQFADSTRYYRQDNPMVYMDPAQQNSGAIPKITRIRGIGVTVPAQAWHLARYKERGNQFLLRTGAFRTDTAGVACRPFNVVALQHDTPQWGFGGRTLPGSTTSVLLIDRSDIPFVEGTSYSAMVMHPDLLRLTTTAGAVTTSTSPPGYAIALSAWANTSRITRAIINGHDCAVLSSAVGSITISAPPGFVPATGQSVSLHDTDILETAPVSAVTITGTTATLTLSTPLSRVPQNYSNYIYGAAGATKWVRVTNVKKADDLRSTIEYIDYDASVYDVATPTVGETSAQQTTNPGVTSLTGAESFQQVSGTYVTFVNLAWKRGPDTAGVGIYARITNGTGDWKEVDRITGYVASWKAQQPTGSTMDYKVVGFDSNDVYQAIGSAPTVTVAAEGIANNLLLGSSFESGFTYWNITPRAGDTFAPDFSNDGEAVYTVNGSAITGSTNFAIQQIPASKWAIGDYLMLSGYLEDTCASPSAPNVGVGIFGIVFYDASGTQTALHQALPALNGTTPVLNRYNTEAVQIPAGTAAVVVYIGVGGPTVDIPAGSTLTFSHLLLEEAEASQTLPSAWADLDVTGQVLDIFTSGSSSGLRVQGSVLPSFTAQFSYSSTDTTLTYSWTSLVIVWPDGATTQVQDGSITVSGLTASTSYWGWIYFDVVYGGVKLATPSVAVGTPASLSTVYDATAEAICKQDNHVPLTPGGLQLTTAATGSTGSGTGGGSDTGGGTGGRPITCTVRGTDLMTPEGPVSNEVLKARFDRGEDVFLVGRNRPERIRAAQWVEVPEFYVAKVKGYRPFGCSASHMVATSDGYRWIETVADGALIDTIEGMRPIQKTRFGAKVDVLRIELEGPSHEYQVVDGVWTHNMKITPPVQNPS